MIIFDKKYKILNIVNKFKVLKKNRKSLWLLKKQIPLNCVTDVSSVFLGTTQWIGATDKLEEGSWIWTSGDALDANKTHWFPGEPNDGAGGQDCLTANFRTEGSWDDFGCRSELPFHCQVISHRKLLHGRKFGCGSELPI